MRPADIARWCAWIVVPLAGMIWVATWYRSNWYYYDEWTTIDRSLGSWSTIFDGHQGHLWVLSSIVYRLQRVVFGLEGHQLVWLAHMGSLAAMHVCLALLLRRLGLSTLFALLAATVATYFGPGGQNVVWEFQWSLNLALALCFFAAFVALRETRKESALRSSAITVAVLLVLAAASDSGLAAIGGIYVGIVLLLSWPRRFVVMALAPPVVTHLAWLTFGEGAVTDSASFDTLVTFASRLFFLSAGSLVGGGETGPLLEGTPSSPTIPISGAWLGAIACTLAVAGAAYGFARHRLTRKVVVNLAAGLTAAVAAVVSITQSRAWLIVPSGLAGSRYLQWVALFLLIAFAPALGAALRPSTESARRIVTGFAAVGLVAVFVANLGQLGPVRRFNERWGQDVKTQVGWAVTVLSEGCGKGQRPDPDAQPIPDLAPQVTVDVLQRVLADGSLPSSFGIPPEPGTRDIICRSVKSGR